MTLDLTAGQETMLREIAAASTVHLRGVLVMIGHRRVGTATDLFALRTAGLVQQREWAPASARGAKPFNVTARGLAYLAGRADTP